MNNAYIDACGGRKLKKTFRTFPAFTVESKNRKTNIIVGPKNPIYF